MAKKKNPELLLFSTPERKFGERVKEKLDNEKLKFKYIDCTAQSKTVTKWKEICEIDSKLPVTVIVHNENIRYWKYGVSIDTTEIRSILEGAR